MLSPLMAFAAPVFTFNGESQPMTITITDLDGSVSPCDAAESWGFAIENSNSTDLSTEATPWIFPITDTEVVLTIDNLPASINENDSVIMGYCGSSLFTGGSRGTGLISGAPITYMFQSESFTIFE